MRISDLDILIVPGLGGSGPGHWQHRWAEKFSTGRMVTQDDFSRPQRDAWVGRLLDEIAASRRPVALVGHSLGALTAASALSESPDKQKIVASFLVAPPDLASPALPEGLIDPEFLSRAPTEKLVAPGVLVASRNDPYASFDHAEALAKLWGLDLADAGEAGHINADSGHGPWPEGLMRLAGLLSKLPAR